MDTIESIGENIMQYEGKVYRPWTEANSLLIQVTIGCTVNTCTFCSMFRDKRFRVRDLEDIFKDIEQARAENPHVESIFLIDGDVMAVRTDVLQQILDKITETFPEIKNIALYAGYNNVRRKSVKELKALKQAGLTMVYAGLESGDAQVLKYINKGMTPEHALKGAAMLKDAGIRVLASFIFGLGGKARSKEHIVETTRLVNLMAPEEIAPMGLAIQPGTEMEQDVQTGAFVRATPLQILEEEKYLLEHLTIPTYYWGDHGNNVSPMRGWLPQHQEEFSDNIAHEIATNPITQDSVIQTFSW